MLVYCCTYLTQLSVNSTQEGFAMAAKKNSLLRLGMEMDECDFILECQRFMTVGPVESEIHYQEFPAGQKTGTNGVTIKYTHQYFFFWHTHQDLHWLHGLYAGKYNGLKEFVAVFDFSIQTPIIDRMIVGIWFPWVSKTSEIDLGFIDFDAFRRRVRVRGKKFPKSIIDKQLLLAELKKVPAKVRRRTWSIAGIRTIDPQAYQLFFDHRFVSGGAVGMGKRS